VQPAQHEANNTEQVRPRFPQFDAKKPDCSAKPCEEQESRDSLEQQQASAPQYAQDQPDPAKKIRRVFVFLDFFFQTCLI
jgi:hypothetical protein